MTLENLFDLTAEFFHLGSNNTLILTTRTNTVVMPYRPVYRYLGSKRDEEIVVIQHQHSGSISKRQHEPARAKDVGRHATQNVRCQRCWAESFTLIRGTTVDGTYGIHKNLPGIYLTIFTINNNIRS